MIGVIARVVFDAAVIAAVLFTAAGTLTWTRAWVLVAVLLVVRILTAVIVFRVNPALMRERAKLATHRDQPLADKLFLLTFMFTAFIGLPALAALDVSRWHLWPSPPLPASILGLGMFVAGWIIIALALSENAFAVTQVRVQGERQHAVVDTGLYSLVRHPMYTGNLIVNLGLSLWLGSYVAELFAIVPLALLIARVGLEERFLERELTGYREYETRVPYRMLPGIW